MWRCCQDLPRESGEVLPLSREAVDGWVLPAPLLAPWLLTATLSCLADRHHGTPMLLEGVKCIGAEFEYDSEQSDWHGFD